MKTWQTRSFIFGGVALAVVVTVILGCESRTSPRPADPPPTIGEVLQSLKEEQAAAYREMMEAKAEYDAVRKAGYAQWAPRYRAIRERARAEGKPVPVMSPLIPEAMEAGNRIGEASDEWIRLNGLIKEVEGQMMRGVK